VKSKVMVVGDIHGDWASLNTLITKKKPDIILQCGDFGWWPTFSRIKSTLYREKEWSHTGVKPQETTIYWCDGNHEDHSDLSKHKEITELYKGINYCPRGSTITLPDNRVVLFIGGAESIDRRWRTAGVDWFAEELINNDDLDKCLVHDRVDIVISHTCPFEFHVVTKSVDKYNDPSQKALSVVLDKYKPDQWFFGHFHKNQIGKRNNTYWECLDYPRNGNKWWRWL